MKRVIVTLLILLLATSAFAAPKTKAKAKATESSWAKSYNKDGQFNVYASLGWAWGFTASVAGEFIITQFDIGPVPLDFGVAVRGAFEFFDGGILGAYGYNGVYWGAGPLATLHLGLAKAPIEFFISAGLALWGYSWSDPYYTPYAAVNFGFASVEGVIWHLSPAIGLILEGGYMGNAGVWGVGVELQL